MTRGQRITAARYLRTLATVEKLAWLGNESEVRRLVAGIDPIEACELADALEREDEPQIPQLRLLDAPVPLLDMRIADGVARLACHPESLRV